VILAMRRQMHAEMICSRRGGTAIAVEGIRTTGRRGAPPPFEDPTVRTVGDAGVASNMKRSSIMSIRGLVGTVLVVSGFAGLSAGSASAQIPPGTCSGLTATVNVAGSGPIQGTSGNDVIIGTAGNDTIFGNGGDDKICGRGGNDTIEGNQGTDKIHGEDGDDLIYGEGAGVVITGGNDQLFGDAGQDVLHGRVGNDRLDGGADADTLFGENGADTLIGVGDGVRDDLDAGSGPDRCTVDGLDHATSCESVG
jgi:Ca2+-binding RTX toxin-like protein